MAPRYLPAGECALVVEYGETADRGFHDQVLALDAALAAAQIAGVLETVPTYRSLMIHIDPRRLGITDLVAALETLRVAPIAGAAGTHWCLPACYDPPHGEDLGEVATLLSIPPETVADLHVSARYRVVMYGFAPGFVFLDGLPPDLALSRRRTPRPPAKPGALTIANGQALIASIAMPTGWYVIGRTPFRTFDTKRDPLFPIAVGDIVGFERIDATTFARLEQDAAAGLDVLRDSPSSR